MDRNGLLNIYEQYYRAGLKYGFYLRESTWKSMGQVLFIVGVKEGEKLKGNSPYFNNPKVYVKLYYANSIGEINAATKSRVIKIYDGGTYRYQPVDEDFILPSKESIRKRNDNTRKFTEDNNFFFVNFFDADWIYPHELDNSSS